jgi:hypothetical protein
MRHSAISEEVVNFQEHSVGNLWVVYSHGPLINRLVGAYKNPLCHFVCILCPHTSEGKEIQMKARKVKERKGKASEGNAWHGMENVIQVKERKGNRRKGKETEGKS